jgi:signal transduction histidine kinase/ActR/RegA family two-component response regulator
MDPTTAGSSSTPDAPAPADPSGFSRNQRRTLALLRAGIALGVTLPLILFCIVGAVRYQQVWREARANGERTVRIVGEHALKLFDTSEVLLDWTGELVNGQTDAQITANEAQLHAKLAALVKDLPQIQSVWVVGATGRPLLSNRYLPTPRGLDLSDRESFIAHRAGFRGVFVTGALVGKKSREVFFDMTERRDNPAGGFAGTVQVSLYPKYLIDFYREVAASELDTSIALVRNDGIVIARWPDVGVDARLLPSSSLLREIRAQKTSGSVMLTSTVDNAERLVSYRKVGRYPLYVTAGIRRGAIVAAWVREMAWLALFTIPGSAALGAAGLLALRKTRRELQLANRLYAESVQRKQVEHALLHAQKMEALGHLTGGVAHDFNNLLMVIGMNAQLLKQTSPALADNARLEAIQRSVSGGAKLTRQLLSFSRRQPLLPATIDLHGELPAIAELCAPVLGKTVSMSVQVAPGTPSLSIDRAELELSLINLAINARHAMPAGGRFDVLAGPLAHVPEAQVEIAVRDSGCGIASDILPRVAEPFFSTRPNGEGTGLGLAQVSTMCQRAGGSMVIESTLGEGTTVRLRFPAARGPEPAPQDEAQAPSTFAMRLLLVEDNSEIAAATQLALESLGCSVQRCASADEALAVLRSGPAPDAVLSDIMMPGTMDGIGLARHLREHHPDLPVALMTGYAERLADAEALRLRVLPKPFDVQGLRQMLAYLANSHAPVAGHGVVQTG